MRSAIAPPRTVGGTRGRLPATPFQAAWLGTVATNGAILVSGMATGILAARLLGPADRGALAVVQFWPPLLTALASMSLGEAVVRRHALSRRREALTTTALGAAGLTALAALLLGLFLPLLAGVTGRPEIAGLLLAYHAVFVPLALGSAVLLGLDQAALRWGRVNFVRLLPSSAYLIGLLVLWAIDFTTVASLLWASLIASLAVLVVQVFSVRAELRHRIDRVELSQLLATGARFHAANLLALLASQIDRLWLVLFFDDLALGYFAAATTFASSGVGAVLGAVQLVLFPKLASQAVDDPGGARIELGVALRRTALFLFVVCGAGALTMPVLVPLLFGQGFVPAGWPAALLVLAQIPTGLRQTALRSVRAFGDARTGALSEIAYLAVFPPLAAVLGEAFGLLGITAAVLAGNLVALLPVASRLERHGIEARIWLLPGPTMVRDGWAMATRLKAFLFAR